MAARDPRTPEEKRDWDELGQFLRRAEVAMRDRMIAGGVKFGLLSWRKEPYTDNKAIQRLRRAVNHLEYVIANYASSPEAISDEELLKRAADVANQAFMAADPKRHR